MNPEKDCKRFDFCSAPICPMRDVANDTWYPDEEICRLREFTVLPWIRNQRKLAKKAKVSFYFTPGMLQQNCKIKKGIKGINPDKEKVGDEERWLMAHPEKKEMSEEQKEKLRKRMHQVRSTRRISY